MWAWHTIQIPIAKSILSDEPDPSVDERWMRRALLLAENAAEADEAPIGCVIVQGDRLIGEGYNLRESLKDPTAHAEMIAITQAAQSLEDWRLERCTLYVTLEPCPMCAGAILQARVPRIVFGAVDPKAGAVESVFRLLSDARLNHRCRIVGGVLAEPCGAILTEFFAAKRRLGKK
jgi:tRNA(adenine34) deaminase